MDKSAYELTVISICSVSSYKLAIIPWLGSFWLHKSWPLNLLIAQVLDSSGWRHLKTVLRSHNDLMKLEVPIVKNLTICCCRSGRIMLWMWELSSCEIALSNSIHSANFADLHALTLGQWLWIEIWSQKTVKEGSGHPSILFSHTMSKYLEMLVKR